MLELFEKHISALLFLLQGRSVNREFVFMLFSLLHLNSLISMSRGTTAPIHFIPFHFYSAFNKKYFSFIFIPVFISFHLFSHFFPVLLTLTLLLLCCCAAAIARKIFMHEEISFHSHQYRCFFCRRMSRRCRLPLSFLVLFRIHILFHNFLMTKYLFSCVVDLKLKNLLFIRLLHSKTFLTLHRLRRSSLSILFSYITCKMYEWNFRLVITICKCCWY